MTIRLSLAIAVILAAQLAFSGPVLARDLAIALSPYDSAEGLKHQVKQIIGYLTTLEPGDNAVLIDGYYLHTIGTFKVPSGALYQSPKARIGANRTVVAALLRFAENAVPPGGAGQPSVAGALRLPQLLRYVAQLKETDGLDLLILGSMRYDDPADPAFSMADGHFPGDGHLGVSRAKSPFGVKGQETLLKGLRVHVVVRDDPATANDRLAYYIQRFVTLLIDAQGAAVASYAGDMSSVFERIRRHAAPLAHDFVRQPSDKLEMIQLRPVQLERTIFDRPLSAEPLPPEALRRAEHVEVGVSWDCEQCDLDVYARPMPGAPVLFFGHTRSDQGRYWKDYRTQKETGYETVGFQVPLDLRAVWVAINFYGGHAPQGVNGEVRLSANGRTYASRFHIKATKGVGASGMKAIIASGRSKRPETLIVDLVALARSGTKS